MARVPLVVVITSVLPRQTSRREVAGRVAQVEPVDRQPLPLAGRAAPCPAGSAAATAGASSISPQGTTASQPAARAWTITVVARRTSTTTATPPRGAPGGIRGRQQVNEDCRVWLGHRLPPRSRRSSQPFAQPVAIMACRPAAWGDPTASTGQRPNPAEARPDFRTFAFPRVDNFRYVSRPDSPTRHSPTGPQSGRIVIGTQVPSRRGAWMHESKGSISADHGPQAIHHRPDPFRTSGAVDAGGRTVNVVGACRARGPTTRAAVVGGALHEGVRAGGRGPPALRRALLQFPWARLYEHPWMNCALAIERSYQGEPGVFVGLFRAPEQPDDRPAPGGPELVQAPAAGAGRASTARRLRFSRVPHADPPALLVEHAERLGLQAGQAVRHVRADELRGPGAESLHPISPLTTTLTFGPISPAGRAW